MTVHKSSTKNTSATLSRAERCSLTRAQHAKLRKLLRTQKPGSQAESLEIGLSLLESLRATRGDYEAVFTDRVISTVVRDPSINADTVARWETLFAKFAQWPDLLVILDHHVQGAVRRRKGSLNLDGVEVISRRTAQALAAREASSLYPLSLCLNGLRAIDYDVALALAEFSGSLELDGLESIDIDVATALVGQKRGSLSLNGLRRLSDEAGKALAFHKGGGLLLDGLSAVSPAVADALSDYMGDVLSLNGLQTIKGGAAKSLQMRHGGLVCLNGLQSLSDALAISLGQSKRDLQLRGITSLSLKAARALAMHRGMVELGVKAPDDEVAAALAKYRGSHLDLPDLEAASPKAVALLQAVESVTLPEKFRPIEATPGPPRANRGPTTAESSILTPEDARTLLTRVGVLRLSNAIAISEVVADILSKHRGGALILPQVAELSDASAASLSRHKGPLHLTGLTALTDIAAYHLGKRKGTLRLDSVEALSEAAAHHLSRHSGALYLSGLKSLTDEVASGLSRHDGFINLKSVAVLSDGAAATLGLHKGGINLSGVNSLSDAAAEHLCRLRFTTTNRLGSYLRVTPIVAKQLKAARIRLSRRGKKDRV